MRFSRPNRRTRTHMSNENEYIETMIEQLFGRELPLEQEHQILSELMTLAPERALRVLSFYAEERHVCRGENRELRKSNKEMYEVNRALTAIPHHVAKVAPRGGEGANQVYVQNEHGAMMLVAVAPHVDMAQLTPFTDVLLTENRNCVIGVCPPWVGTGEVAEVAEVMEGMVVLKTQEGGGQETALVVGELRDEGVSAGDRVLFDRTYHAAYRKMPKKEMRHSHVLEPVSSETTLDQIGGLDDVKEQMVYDLLANLDHKDLMEAHHVRPSKGLLLIGPPGNGKSMLMRALANFVRSNTEDGEVAVYQFPPGRHRSMWYGQTEQNLNHVFDFAENLLAQGVKRVIILIDEVDQLGQRSNEIGNSIDSRVLPVLLERLDGLSSNKDILFIATSNRADDLLDEALLRPGRFGDKATRIGPPAREAARSILQRYLTPDLPYRENGVVRSGEKPSEALINAVLARIYSPDLTRTRVATVVLRGGRMDVPASAVVSGAMLENVTRKAKMMSIRNAVAQNRPGISLAHVLRATEEELAEAARRLKTPARAREALNLGRDVDITDVLLAAEQDALETEGRLVLRAS